MDHDKKKNASHVTAKKGAPLGLIIVLSVAIGAVIGSGVTYLISKPQSAPVKESNFSTVGDTSPRQANPMPAQPQYTPAPQPPGEVPPGKVWSAEHGHWHDAPGALPIPAPAPAPAEKSE